VEGYFFAGLAVALVQYVRRRDARLLPLVALFAALMAAETRSQWDPWQDGLRLVAGGAALVLVAMLSRERMEEKR
jgi:peptidoglycan/LPS O-acetylase OafA/YrhL